MMRRPRCRPAATRRGDDGDGARYRDRLGGTPRRGLLFEGPPGTGKTHLAKAMAHHAGVPFFFVSATSLQSMWYGATARKIRSYFRELRTAARREGGAIGFIEEIDAIATTRGGLSRSAGLLRPGRFDRRLTFDLPAKVARRDLIDLEQSSLGQTNLAGRVLSDVHARDEVDQLAGDRPRAGHGPARRQPPLVNALLDRDELVGDEIAAVLDEAAAISERVIDVGDHPLRCASAARAWRCRRARRPSPDWP